MTSTGTIDEWTSGKETSLPGIVKDSALELTGHKMVNRKCSASGCREWMDLNWRGLQKSCIPISKIPNQWRKLYEN
jgi:hypothetical protein